jgi:multiple sugar transport system substrate-binding protein
MKKYVNLAVVFVMVAALVLVAACAGTEAPPVVEPTKPSEQAAATPKPTAEPGEDKELTIITLTGPRYQFATEGMAEEFNKTHPGIKVNVESFPHEEYVGRMAMEVAGEGTTYDIVWIDYKFIGGYADAGFLLPIDKYLEQDAEFWADFQGDVYPTILNMYEYKDNWYALPNDGNTEVFYYRKDILEEAGVEPPKTWEELLEVAPKLNNPPDVYAICGNFARFWATDFWLSLFYSQDKQVWDENYEPQMESEEAIWAAEAFLELAEYAPPEAVTWEEADVYEAMGSAGICAMAPAQWGGSVLTNPELARFAPNIGVTVVPSIDEAGEMRVLPMGGFGMGINANSPYQDEAWEYIKFHVGRENQQMLVGYTGQPARTSALTDPVNVEVAPYFPALGENLGYAKPRPVIAEYAQAEQIIGVELNEMLLGNKTAAEAMKDANELVREVLVESGKLQQ